MPMPLSATVTCQRWSPPGPAEIVTRGGASPPVLDRVTDQVAEETEQLVGVAHHRGQPPRHLDHACGVLDRPAQQFLDLRDDRLEVDGLELARLASDAGEPQQVLYQLRHPRRAVRHEVEMRAGFPLELVPITLLEETREPEELAKGLLKVVRRHVRELLQLPVGPLQLDLGRFQLGTDTVAVHHDPQLLTNRRHDRQNLIRGCLTGRQLEHERSDRHVPATTGNAIRPAASPSSTSSDIHAARFDSTARRTTSGEVDGPVTRSAASPDSSRLAPSADSSMTRG